MNDTLEFKANTPFGEVTYFYTPQEISPFRRKVEAHHEIDCPRCEEKVKAQLLGNRGWFCPKCRMKILSES